MKAIQFTHIPLDINHNCTNTGGSENLEELLREGRERQSLIFRVNTNPNELATQNHSIKTFLTLGCFMRLEYRDYIWIGNIHIEIHV